MGMHGWTHAPALAAAAALALSGCTTSTPSSALPVTTPSLGPGAPAPRAPATSGPVVLQSEPELSDERGPWEGARTDGDRAVILSFTGAAPGDGPCEAEYVGTARVRFGAMAVSVAPVEESSGDEICPAIGYTRTLRVELPEPLDGRHLVDEQGRLGPLLDGAALLSAPAPPPGYAFASEFARAGGGASWTVQYTSGERAPVVLVTHTEDIGEPLDAGLIVLDRLTIRGHEALLLGQFPNTPLRIVWKERGAVIGVQNNVTSGPGPGDGSLLPVEDLIAFARSLR